MTLTVRRLNCQLPPTEEKLKPRVHIWMERLRAKYFRSRLKNERAKVGVASETQSLYWGNSKSWLWAVRVKMVKGKVSQLNLSQA